MTPPARTFRGAKKENFQGSVKHWLEGSVRFGFSSITATSIGIVYGWGEAGGTHGIGNCLVSGGPYTSTDAIDLLLAETGADISVTNCYRTKSYGCTQGDYSLAPSSYYVERLGSQWELVDGVVTLKMPTSTAGLTNVENPVFEGVVIESGNPSAVNFDGGLFFGSYSPLADVSGLLLDEHNPDNGACRAALSLSRPIQVGKAFEGWYTDAALTTPVTTIPFDANGTVKLYAKWVEIKGDVNGDGVVTITDAALVMEYVKTRTAPAGFVMGNADVDGSGGITTADAVEILKMILE